MFNDGNFSESGTFLISDWFSHTPREVLAANFNFDTNEFSEIPTSELYIFEGKVPGPLQVKSSGGTVRIADSKNFDVATQVAAALVEVEPGGMRELHWHPNADEWQYYIEGQARMTVFAAEGRARTFDYQAGDVGYVLFPMGHYRPEQRKNAAAVS